MSARVRAQQSRHIAHIRDGWSFQRTYVRGMAQLGDRARVAEELWIFFSVRHRLLWWTLARIPEPTQCHKRWHQLSPDERIYLMLGLDDFAELHGEISRAYEEVCA